MAEFTLSTRQLSRGRGSGGLKPQLIRSRGGAASIQAAQINPSSATIGFTPVPLPQQVKDITQEAAQAFMETSIKAAFDYQERESEYTANEAHRKFNEMMRDSYNGRDDGQGGWIPGYSASTGAAAAPAYELYKSQMDEQMDAILDEMDPRTKQKAIFKLQSVKSTYLGKAATHRATQMQIAKEQDAYLNEQDIIFDISTLENPLDIYKADSNGETFKSKFYSNRQKAGATLAETEAAWADTIKDIGYKKYIDIASLPAANAQQELALLQRAAAAARDFASTVGAAELAGSPKLSELRKDIKLWDAQARRAANSSRTLEIKEREALEKRNYAETDRRIDSDQAAGRIWTRQELQEARDADPSSPGSMSKETYRTYYNAWYKGSDMVGDVLEIEREKAKILETLGTPEEDIVSYRTNPNIGPEGILEIRKFIQDAKTPNGSKWKYLQDTVKAYLTVPKWQERFKNKEFSILMSEATEFARQEILTGLDPVIVVERFKRNYNPAYLQIRLGPKFEDGTQPVTIQDLMTKIKQFIAIDNGTIPNPYDGDPEAEQLDRDRIQKYKAWFKEHTQYLRSENIEP